MVVPFMIGGLVFIPKIISCMVLIGLAIAGRI